MEKGGTPQVQNRDGSTIQGRRVFFIFSKRNRSVLKPLGFYDVTRAATAAGGHITKGTNKKMFSAS